MDDARLGAHGGGPLASSSSPRSGSRTSSATPGDDRDVGEVEGGHRKAGRRSRSRRPRAPGRRGCRARRRSAGPAGSQIAIPARPRAPRKMSRPSRSSIVGADQHGRDAVGHAEGDPLVTGVGEVQERQDLDAYPRGRRSRGRVLARLVKRDDDAAGRQRQRYRSDAVAQPSIRPTTMRSATRRTTIARIGLMSIAIPPPPRGGSRRRKMFRYGSVVSCTKSTNPRRARL